MVMRREVGIIPRRSKSDGSKPEHCRPRLSSLLGVLRVRSLGGRGQSDGQSGWRCGVRFSRTGEDLQSNDLRMRVVAVADRSLLGRLGLPKFTDVINPNLGPISGPTIR